MQVAARLRSPEERISLDDYERSLSIGPDSVSGEELLNSSSTTAMPIASIAS